MPVDDWTQDATISAEYAGISPWGMNWNGMLRYDVSLYTDAFSSFSAENPFGGPGSPHRRPRPLCPTARRPPPSTTATASARWARRPTTPRNTVMGQIGVDLPGFKSNRYMATFQFTEMTQNQAFIPMTINGARPDWRAIRSPEARSNLAPMPRNSLYGQIDTTLFNNVLATQLTSDLKNKLSYRYLRLHNNTPALTLHELDRQRLGDRREARAASAAAPTRRMSSCSRPTSSRTPRTKSPGMRRNGRRSAPDGVGAVPLLRVRRQRDQRIFGKAVRPHQSDGLVLPARRRHLFVAALRQLQLGGRSSANLGVAASAGNPRIPGCATSTSPIAIATSPISTPTSRRRFPALP